MVLPAFALGAPAYFTYQGQIIKPNGQALEANNVYFQVEILSPEPELCVLYEESHTLNMINSNGIFAVTVGEGARPGDGSFQDLNTLTNALNNFTGVVSPDDCVAGPTYTPDPSDGRKLRITFDDGSGPVTLAQDHNVVSVPYAANAASVSGITASELLRINSGTGFNLTQTNLDFVFNDANWTELQALLDGTSSSFSAGAPTADVDNNNQKIINLDDPNPVADTDAVNVRHARSYIGGRAVDTTNIGSLAGGADVGKVISWDGTQWITSVIDDTTKLPTAGGTMSGPIDMGNQNITNVDQITTGGNVTVGGGIGVTNGLISGGNLQVNNEMELRLLENSANGTEYVSLKSPATLGGNVNLTLPNNDGDPGQYLQTDGSGILSWQDVNAGVTQVFGRSGNVSALAGDYDASQIDFDNTYGGDVDTATNVQAGIEELSTEKLAKSGDSMTGNLVMDLNGGVTTEIRFQDTGTRYIGFKAPNTITAPSSFVWTLPVADGTPGQVLSTSGAGVLSWVDKEPLDYVSDSRALTAGAGLTGGGDLSTDRSFDIGAGNGITVNADDIEVRAGSGISVNGSGVNVDIAGTADEAIVQGTDSLLIRDSSDAGNLKEMTRANFVLSESEVDSFVANNGYLQDGGNSTGANLTVGNNDNFDLNFETNNTIAMTVANSGMVGIGTTAPTHALEIKGGSPMLSVETPTGDIALRAIGNGNGRVLIGEGTEVDNSFQLQVLDDALINDRLVVSGSLGIGTSTPLAPFHLTAGESFDASAGASQTGTGFLLDNRGIGASSHGSAIAWSKSDSTERRAAISSVQEGSGSDRLGIAFFTHPSTTGTNPMAEAMRIDYAGNVGIGTTSPSNRLDIQTTDDSVPLKAFNTTKNWGAVIRGRNNANTLGNHAGLLIQNDAAEGGAIGRMVSVSMGNSVSDSIGVIGTKITDSTNGYGDLLFLNNGSGGYDERMRITSDGNVGIGTIQPSSLLQVSGGVQIGDDLDACDGTKAGTLKYVGGSVSFCDGSNWEAFGTASGGEANTASTVGAGSPIFKQKSGVDFEFRSLASANTKIGVSTVADVVTLTVDEAQFDPTAIPVGTTPLTATTLQAAIAELNSDKVATSTQIISGAGLTGGGNLSTNLTLAIGAGNGINVNADDIEVAGGSGISVDGSGVNVDITNETSEAIVASGDEILIHDVSAGGLRKMTRSNFVLSSAEVEAIIADDGYLVNGGNTLGANLTTGTNDAFDLRFETNDTTRMTINSGGLIGIGTTNPLHNLHINSAVPGIRLQDSDTGAYGLIVSDNSGSIILQADDNNTNPGSDIIFQIDGSERLRLNSGGFVGVGTSSPVVALDVNTGSINAAEICDENNANCLDLSSGISGGGGDINNGGNDGIVTLGSNNNILRLESNDSTVVTVDNSGGFATLMLQDGAGAGVLTLNEATGIFDIGAFAGEDITFSNDGNESMRIQSTTQNVGIGTTAPERLLHVNGAMRLTPQAVPSSPSAGDLYFDSADSNKLKFYDGSSWVEAGGSAGGGTPAGSTGQLQFNNAGSFAATSGLSWDSASEELNISSTGFDYGLNASSTNGIAIHGSSPVIGVYGYSSASTGVYGESDTGYGVDALSLDSYAIRAQSDTSVAGYFTSNSGPAIVTGTGNVGIGTTAPAVALDVHTGSINAAEICDENNTNCLDLSSGIGGSSGDFLADGSVAMTGQFDAASGNASAPSISFAADQDSGFYRIGANELGLSLGGSLRFQFAPSGFVAGTFAGTGFMTRDGLDASTPAFSFWADSDTGIFRPASNQIGFSLGGTERLRLDANGRVGIGSTAPSELLTVNATGAGNHAVLQLQSDENPGIKLDNTTDGWIIQVEDSPGGLLPGTSSSSLVIAGTGTTEPTNQEIEMGDVGGIFATFGSTSSSVNRTLRVRGNASTAGAIRLSEDSDNGLNDVEIIAPASLANNYTLTLPVDDGDANQVLQTDGSGALSWVDPVGGSGDFLADGSVDMTGALTLRGSSYALNFAGDEDTGIFRSGSANQFRLYAGGQQRMIVSPEAIQSPTVGSWFLSTSVPSKTTPSFSFSSDVDTGIYRLGADLMSFTTAGEDRLVIDSTGNIGIGTTTPARKLHVDGPARLNPGALPGAPAAGDIAIDSGDSNKLKFFDGSSWVDTGAAGGAGYTDGDTILANVGASSTPGFSFDGDTNTGIFSPYGDAMAFSLGGNERMTIDSGSLYGWQSGSFFINLWGGGVTNPSYSFRDDDDTGVFRPAANSIGFTNGGTETLRIDPTGNLGIGTSAPARKLHINGPMRLTASTLPGSPVAGDIAVDSGDSNKLKFYDGSAWVEAGGGASGGDGHSLDSADGSEIDALFITNEGRMVLTDTSGIIAHDTTPNDLSNAYAMRTSSGLELFSFGYCANSDCSGFNSFLNIDGGASVTTSYQNFALNAGAELLLSNSGASTPAMSFSADSNTGLFNPAADNIGFSTNGSEKVRIDNTGNVGIGTTAPTALMQASEQDSTSYSSSSSSLSAPGGPSLKITNTEEADNTASFLKFEATNVYQEISTGFLGIVSDNGGADRIVLGQGMVNPFGSDYYDEQMTITRVGDVGIGTADPEAKLEVVGEVRSVDSAGDNRLWGEGRPGTQRYGTSGVEAGLCSNGSVNFGLSYTTAAWYGAQAACPQGTWVCTAAERGTGSCNTSRPDAGDDAINCMGNFVDYTSNQHRGWVADIGGYKNSGYNVYETGTTNDGLLPCNSLPVWCCSN